MQNSNSKAGTKAQQSTEAEVSTSSSHNTKPLVSGSLVSKEQFYTEVIEKVFQWSNRWEEWKKDNNKVQPLSTQDFAKSLIKFEKQWFS